MHKFLKYYTVIIFLIFNTSCLTIENKLSGSWESIKIENDSSLFKKTLPSYEKGEVRLSLNPDRSFTWINYKEKLNLSGTYSVTGNKIYFNIESESSPLQVEFKLKDNKLIIITDDGFTFTFLKEK